MTIHSLSESNPKPSAFESEIHPLAQIFDLYSGYFALAGGFRINRLRRMIRGCHRCRSDSHNRKRLQKKDAP